MSSNISTNVTSHMVEKFKISANVREGYPVLHGCKVVLSDGRKESTMLQTAEINSLIQVIANERIKYTDKENFSTYSQKCSDISAEQILTRIFASKDDKLNPMQTTFILKIAPFPVGF
jgi:hypothetical protein